MIASVFGIGLAVVAVVGAVVGSYLFLRANPQKKAKLDAEVNDIAKKL
jgi:hypothetical protein